jgi:hypothetical protein
LAEGPLFHGGTAYRENKSKNRICTKVDDKTGVELPRTVSEATMSLNLPLVSLVKYLQEGEVNPGDEGKVIRFEKKMLDWRRDVVGGSKNFTRKDMSSDMCQVENSFDGYWCKGVKCLFARTHRVLHEMLGLHARSVCMQHTVGLGCYGAGLLPLFLSCDVKTKTNVWMSKPNGSMTTINYKRGEKKRKEREDKERTKRKKRKIENCADNQKSALNCGYCCHQHAEVAKMEHKESKKQKKKKKETVNKMIDGPDH